MILVQKMMGCFLYGPPLFFVLQNGPRLKKVGHPWPISTKSGQRWVIAHGALYFFWDPEMTIKFSAPEHVTLYVTR